MQYLDERIYFVSDSDYTGAMTASSSEYMVSMAKGYNNYNGDRCASVHNVDWFSFNLLPLRDRYEGRTAVLEVSYTTPICEGRRLNTEIRTIGTIII